MKKRKLIKGIKHEQSSGNVFSDVGLPEKYLAKALLVAEIHRIIVQRKLTQEQAASVLGIDQPRVSALLRGKLNLFSMERVMELLARLGSVEIRIAPSQTPSFRVVFNQKTLHHASLLKGANLFHFRTQSTSFPTFDSPDVIWVMPEQSGADNISDGLLGSFGSIGYENATLIKECGKTTYA